MDPGRAAKIRKEIEKLRRSPNNIRHRQLASIAQKLGRVRDSSRNNEPTYVNKSRKWFPLSIPDHSVPLKKGTALKILDQLEEDLLKLEDESESEAGEE